MLSAIKRLLSTMVIILLFAPISWGNDDTVLTFLHFNDTYAFSPRDGLGGFAPLKTLIDQEIKAAKGPTLITFGGDAISPTAMGGITQGAHMIELLNAVSTQVAVPGNHEFDFGPEIFKKRLEESSFPWLGANILAPDGTVCCGMKDHIIVDMGGIKVGIFGLVTETTADFSSTGDNSFEPYKKTAEQQVQALKDEGAEIIVALTHLAFSEDMSLSDVDGINLVLGGHEHDAYAYVNSGKRLLVLKVGWDAQYLGVVKLAVQRGKNGVSVKAPSWKVLPVQDLKPVPSVQKIVNKYEQQQDQFNVKIGTTATPFNTILALVGGVENPLGDVITDAMRTRITAKDGTKADAALIHGFNFRGMSKNSGDEVTHLNILEALPFANSVVLVELTGEELKAVLEHSVSDVAPGSRGLSRFVQLSGLEVTYDPTKTARTPGCLTPENKGERILSIKVDGMPYEPTQKYQVVINNFMAEGGNGYCMLKDATRIEYHGKNLLTDLVLDEITSITTITEQPPRIINASN